MTTATQPLESEGPASVRQTAARLAFVVVCLAVLVLPIVAMRTKVIEEQRLNGVYLTAKRPELGVKAVQSEKFQKEMIEWFEQNYGLKPTLVRLDNTIGYRVFGETRFETQVRIGTNDVLFNPELLGFENQPPTPFARVEKSAALAHEAQTKLLARGKVLVLIILPSKMLVYPNHVPPRWRDPLHPVSPPYWQTTNYEPYIRELHRRNVMFIDGPTALATAIREKPETIYGPEGRHLNAPIECMLYEMGLEQARPLLPTKTIPHLDCTTEITNTPSGWEEECDFYRLLNAWGRPKTKQLALLKPEVPESAPRHERANILIMGSSFAGRYLLETTRNHLAAHVDYFYYNRTLIDVELKETPIPDPKSAAWRDLALSQDLYIVPIPQEHLPDSANEFFEQLIAALTN
jgi:hypothetical protein